MRRVLPFLVLLAPLQAQVKIKFTPEPMVVPTAQVATAKQMGRWIVEACNDGVAPVNLPWERVSMATSDIRFIDPGDAEIVLVSNQARTPAAKVMRATALLAQALAIGLAVTSKANLGWAAALSVGSTIAPMVIQSAAGQVPSIAPLTTGQKYPVALPPGGCFTDHRFAAKTAKVKIETVVIGASTLVNPVYYSVPPISPGSVTVIGKDEAEATFRFDFGTNQSGVFLATR